MKIKTITSFKTVNRLLQSGTVFCVFDTETTGVASSYDRVIELGALTFNKNGILSSFSELFDPGIPLPEICRTISHITDDMVAGKPKIEEKLQSFLDFSKDTVLIAHNAPFDVKFMNAELLRAGFPPLENQVIDTLALSRWAYPQNGSWKLQTLASQFSIDVHDAHRAFDDARVCMEVFLRCISDTMDRQLPYQAPDSADSEQIPLF